MSGLALIVVPLTTFTHTEGDGMADDLDNDGLVHIITKLDTLIERDG